MPDTVQSIASSRGRRTRIHLPRELVEKFRLATPSKEGATGSMLVYHWVLTAAIHARAGEYDKLPPRSLTPTTSGDQLPVAFPQTLEESQKTTSLLRDGGSSTRAVVAACMEAYLEADADPIEMVWPARKRQSTD